MTELEAKIEELRALLNTAVATVDGRPACIRKSDDRALVRLAINVLPTLLDLAASSLARGGEGESATDQSKGGDANDVSEHSRPDATSPGRECEPAGASEELRRRLTDPDRFVSGVDAREAASLIRRLVQELDEARAEIQSAFDVLWAAQIHPEVASLSEKISALLDWMEAINSRATTAEAEAERLRAALHDANERAESAQARADLANKLFDQREEYLAGLDARNSELRADNERLREALKPFADRASRYDHDENDNNEPDWCTAAPSIRIGDLRRARTALEGK